MWGSVFWCWDSWTSATWMFFSLNIWANGIFLLDIPEMLIWTMFRLLWWLFCCVCLGCVPVCVLLARTVCRRRCFIITRRGGPLELGALVAWAVPFDDRGNGTGTPPARDSTGVAPYRFSIVDSIMVNAGESVVFSAHLAYISFSLISLDLFPSPLSLLPRHHLLQ